jgi:hypothetical protein
LQIITDYKGKHSRELPSDTSLPDAFLCSLWSKQHWSVHESTKLARRLWSRWWSVICDLCSWCEQDLLSQGCGARLITRTSTRRMCGPTGKCLHWYFQPLPDRVCKIYMFQVRGRPF